MTRKPLRTGREALAAVADEAPVAHLTARTGRPQKLEDGEALRTANIRITPKMHKELKLIALLLETDVSTIIRDALAAYLPKLREEASPATAEALGRARRK